MFACVEVMRSAAWSIAFIPVERSSETGDVAIMAGSLITAIGISIWCVNGCLASVKDSVAPPMAVYSAAEHVVGIAMTRHHCI